MRHTLDLTNERKNWQRFQVLLFLHSSRGRLEFSAVARLQLLIADDVFLALPDGGMQPWTPRRAAAGKRSRVYPEGGADGSESLGGSSGNSDILETGFARYYWASGLILV